MKFDLVIIGGGLVGASLVVALKGSGLKIALIESRVPASLPADASWDSRLYAISPGSATFLQNLGVWQGLEADRITPVYDMTVFGDDDTTHLDFSAYDIGLSELAFIIENRQLQTAVWHVLKSQEQDLEIFNPVQCTELVWHESHVDVQLTDGSLLQTALVIGADGVNSWVRQQAGIEVSQHAYHQIGLVANFSTEQSHRNIAHQWFKRDSVLALLPLPDKRVSMVWSVSEEQAAILLDLPATELCQLVADASCQTLGNLQLITSPVGFPLNFVSAKRLVRPRLALIGDAAHGIHPLAGQGVNLGLRDTRELAAILNARGPQTDCGDFMLLRQYERARKEDILAMELMTDGLQKLFNNTNPTLARLRNLGLEITNRLPLLKNRLMQHALS
ncbi:2-octaprenyl-3-methyl-6-methoxy-1,4-benzoquinol hydroxylase [Nitrosomonas cryotolerans]|uniref:2-octaprenyl-3-methyl-6-methoxy-1,4-benzoquinol hydroxylase n=1 Tax=Nitrosomonas cryotolerans ATCC 49181 TaxID=1131553 RepID=A0A1N6GS24_9PROT|nr:UbiH/UbiF family hydroxylase [Nitrosomonas cryotolerans]SFP40220.1 2-octaprenyl-3-methyl-6-methoxy-1,4-benzoquinol hydroxylase [Nitrosomonas cryotolerans]SIO10326.1 2-octaprenyl-3-methyl-6-methoxy-1,4-benzoquinol hydroxylase [Nitrosomonas cryotolerans ATCC 49181]